jgi:hypothetical protein
MDGWMDGCKNTHQIGALHFPTLNTLANFDQEKIRNLYPTKGGSQKSKEKEVVGVNLETVQTSPQPHPRPIIHKPT